MSSSNYRSPMLSSEAVTELLKQILVQLSLMSGEGKHTDLWAIGKQQHIILPMLVNWIMKMFVHAEESSTKGPENC